MVIRMTKVVMIHEITPEVLQKDLSGFDIITFDDGLYTQYLNHKHFAKFNKKMIFFISTSIIRPENVVPSSDVLYCGLAHERAFKGNFENYMSWDEILELSKLYEIGGHSDKHIKFKNSLKSYPEFKKDTESMISKFNEHNLRINSFCLPYNQDNTLYTAYLKKLGFTVYSVERIAIERI